VPESVRREITFVWLERVEEASARAFETRDAKAAPLAPTGT
jgi:hypothetical protein